jgi:molybdopterin molybdotransferase
MDGYAVRSRDTFGASEAVPALLEVAGEVLMGEIPQQSIGEGQALKIATGGMLPGPADGVVMLEHCSLLDETTIEVSRAISPFDNVIQPDDDYKKGNIALQKGKILRPQDLGVMAGLGLSAVPVFKKPKVAVISTGNEVIPMNQKPHAGQVRDINSFTLRAFCLQAGGEPIMMGLCDDHFEHLRTKVADGLRQADTVWISGGSSVGTRDLTLQVFESFETMELLVHGISISPGKPTIIARIDGKAVIGLPGHTASALVVATVFLAPLLSRLSGEGDHPRRLYDLADARLTRNIESVSGREEYVRIKLRGHPGNLEAEPIFGKSGLLSTLVDADGLLKIDRNVEGLYEGDHVRVMIFHPVREGIF